MMLGGLVLQFLLVALPTQPGAGKQMNWLEEWRQATVAFGTITDAEILEAGKKTTKKIFAVVGSGVIVGFADDSTRTPWLLTARHVFEEPARNWRPDSIRLRLAAFESSSVVDYHGVEIALRSKGIPLWTGHPAPEVDLACIPLRLPAKDLGIVSVPGVVLEKFATQDDVYVGAAVVVLGHPGAVGHLFWTSALVRSGIIAWVAPSDATMKPIVLDAAVFPGNSGGPVFRSPHGMSRDGGMVMGSEPTFLGIVSQARLQKLPVTWGAKDLELVDKSKPVALVSSTFANVAVIEPPGRVRQLLEAARRSASTN